MRGHGDSLDSNVPWRASLAKGGKGRFSKATLPDSETDFMWLLTDGGNAAIAHAGFLVVTGGRSHIAKFTQLRKFDDTIVVRDHHIVINWGGKRKTH